MRGKFKRHRHSKNKGGKPGHKAPSPPPPQPPLPPPLNDQSSTTDRSKEATEAISAQKKHSWMRHSTLFECLYCSILFRNENIYYQHMLAHSLTDPFICVCGQQFSSMSNFNLHLFQDPHGLPEKPHPLSTHLLWLKNALNSDRNPSTRPLNKVRKKDWIECRSVYECKPCEILFRSPCIYAIHKKAHRKDGKFVCRCGKGLDSSYSFNLHLFTQKHSDLDL